MATLTLPKLLQGVPVLSCHLNPDPTQAVTRGYKELQTNLEWVQGKMNLEWVQGKMNLECCQSVRNTLFQGKVLCGGLVLVFGQDLAK